MTVQIAVTRKTVSIEIGPLQELATVRAIAESAVTPAELSALALEIAGSTDAGLDLLRDEVEEAAALKVDKARTVSAAGLATGGGSLSADRTITVPKASGAEAVTGTDDAKAVTPLALKSARNTDSAAMTATVAAEAAARSALIQADVEHPFIVEDQAGFEHAHIATDGSFRTALVDIAGSVAVDADGALSTAIVRIEESEGFSVEDEAGFVIFQVIPGEQVVLPSVRTLDGFDSSELDGPTGSFSAQDIVAYDSRALALSALRTSANPAFFQRPTTKWTVFLGYGQSLGGASEGWPALTKTPPMDGVWMIGGATRGNSPTSTTWTSTTSDVLNPAVAVVQDGSGNILSDAAVAALAEGAYGQGEDTLLGAVYAFRRMWLDQRGLTEDPDHQFIVVNCSVGGRSVVELSPGNSPEYFNRVRTALAKIRTIVGSDTVSLGAVLYKQGEEDYANSTAAAAFETNTRALRAAIQAEAQTAFGQTAPFTMITYQTAGALAKNSLIIGDVQRSMARTEPNWALSSPTYPMTDKGGHLDPNGYRWLSSYDAKVLFQRLALGRQSSFVEPIEAVWRGTEMLVTFDVPVPPIQLKSVYVGTTATDVPEAGLYLTDASGQIAISTVEVAGQATLRLTLAREPTTSVLLYGGRITTALGGTNICDSDPSVSLFNYEYAPGTGQYAGADIPALVGKPYPLNNHCVCFKITASEG